MKSFIPKGILGIALLVLTACQTVPAPEPRLEQTEAPAPRQWLSLLQERDRNFRDLKSFVKTTLETPAGSQSLRQVLLIQGPRTFRMDTLSVFGQPLGVLIVSPQKTLLYDPRHDKSHTGVEVWQIMHRTLGASLDFREYIPLFTGNIPGVQDWQESDLRPLPQNAGWEIQPEDQSSRWWLELDTKTGLPVRLQKWTAGQPDYQVQWNDYRTASGIPFPHSITVHRPSVGDRVTLEFRDPQINRGLPEDAFNLQLP